MKFRGRDKPHSAAAHRINPDLGMKHWIRRNTAMNSLKTIIIAA